VTVADSAGLRADGLAGGGPETPAGLGEDGRFADEASARLRAAQAAMTDLLDEAGLGGARPTQIGRVLGVDKTLAWKIARFVEGPQAIDAARHMPGSAGVEIVLKAAAARGVAGSRVDAVRDADERLRSFVRRHAGDRRSFEAMLAKGGRDDRIESEERKAHYKSGSAVWGVRARVQMLTLALRPSERDPASIDVLQLSGMVGFERLRADVPWIIRRLTNRSDSGSSSTGFAREPLDPEGARGGGLPLVRRFCSEPMPEIRQFRDADGTVYDEIAPGPVGRHGAVSFVAGEIYRSAIPLAWSEDNTEGRYTLTVRTPVEAVVFDLLLHRDLAHFGEPSVRVYGLLEDRPGVGAARGQGAAMYEPEPAQRLGSPPVLQSTRISQHAAVLDEALTMAGWGGSGAFRGYRAELEYPPAPCRVMMVCPAR
jgi:hypothetical protein